MERPVIGFLALGLALCAPWHVAAQEAGAATAFMEQDGGDLVHVASGLRFPASAADFARSDAAVFAANGDYVGVEYTRPLSADGALTIRVAVVKIPGLSPREHFTIARPIALQSLEEARPVAEGPYRGVEGTAGYRGLFTGRHSDNPWMRGLWTFERGEWDLRVRADFPRIDSIQADEAVAALVTALNAANEDRNQSE